MQTIMGLADHGYFLNPQQDDLQFVSDELVSWFLEAHPERLVGSQLEGNVGMEDDATLLGPPLFSCKRFSTLLPQSRAALQSLSHGGDGGEELKIFGAQGTASQPEYYQPTMHRRKTSRGRPEADA
jgi:hypothetical protein